MAKIEEPVDILCEFIRAQYKEPARSGLSKRHTNATETFSGDGAETEFTVSNTKLLCVNEVSVSSSVQTKHVDYSIDLRNNKIIFATAPASGSNNVSVDYDHGSESWIYPDKPRIILSRTKYPRVAIMPISESAERLGISDDSRLHTLTFQIDVLTKKGIVATDYVRILSDGSSATTSENIEGEQLVRVISRGIINAIQRLIRTKIKDKLFGQLQLSNQTIPFDEASKIFRRTVEFQFQAFNTAEEQV